MFDVKTGVTPNSRDFVSTNTKTRYVEDISRNKDMVEFCVALIIYVSSATASSTRLRMHTVMHNDWLYTSWYEHAVGNGSAFLSYVTKYIAYSYISVNTDERYSFLDVTSIKVHKYGFFSLPLSLPRIHFLNVGRLQENISLYLFAIQELLLLLSIDET